MKSQETQLESLKFIESIDLRPFNPIELYTISQSFSRDLLGGIATPPNPGSLKMIKTHLVAPSQEYLRRQEGEHYQIIEISGTNIFVAETTIKDGKPAIVEENGLSVKTREKLTRTKFSSPDDFFGEILAIAEPILRRRPIESLGIIYAFPGEIVNTKLGIDVNSQDHLPKDFYIKNISRKPVGISLVEYLQKNGTNLAQLQTLVVENDTPAALLSTPGSKIGGIVGTGYNLAISVGGKIINLECGGFADVPQPLLSREVDEASDNQKEQLAEKQISGKYLGMQLQFALAKMQAYGVHLTKKSSNPNKFLDGATITYALEGNKIMLLEHLEGNLDDKAMIFLKEVATKLRCRSYQLVATKIKTIIQTFPDEFPENDIIIPIEGSVFWGIPQYQDTVRRIVFYETEKNIIFPRLDHLGSLGATISLLGKAESRLSHFGT